MKHLSRIVFAATLLSLVGCMSFEEEDVSSTSGELGANATTTIFDGTFECSPVFQLPFPPFDTFQVCSAMDGVGHVTLDAAGKYHSIFQGTRTLEVYVNGELRSSQSGYLRQALHVNDDGTIRTAHLDACTEYNDGQLTIGQTLQIANGELIHSSFEVNEGC